MGMTLNKALWVQNNTYTHRHGVGINTLLHLGFEHGEEHLSPKPKTRRREFASRGGIAKTKYPFRKLWSWIASPQADQSSPCYVYQTEASPKRTCLARICKDNTNLVDCDDAQSHHSPTPCVICVPRHGSRDQKPKGEIKLKENKAVTRTADACVDAKQLGREQRARVRHVQSPSLKG